MAYDTTGETVTTSRVDLGSETIHGWLTVVPVIILYLMIAVVPVAFAIWASLHEIALTNPVWEWNGLGNYGNVFELSRFWGSLWRGVMYMVGSTLVQLTVGIWFALVINRLGRSERLVSALVFGAYLTPTIVVVLVSLYLLDPFVGMFHELGVETFGLWDGYLLGNQNFAMLAVVLIGSWKFSAFITIFTLAQLRSIPDQFYEAAQVCGAGVWEMFRDITLPRIKGAILVALLLRSIFMFNKFDIIWMLTKGGPGFITTTLPVLAYNETFIAGDYGLGNAIAVVMFVFLVISGIIYFRVANPSQEVETNA